MRIQLWSYNYAPEPTGIGPVSRSWAVASAARGHEVTVVAAHPHYPEPVWGRRLRPTRSVEQGVEVLRLPLLPGRDSTLDRMRQDASFSAALLAALPLLPPADARVVVSPCFPALAVALLAARLDRTPWLLWLQDILPDGAVGTGLIDESSRALKTARTLERAAYRAADEIVVISDRFAENLLAKGVPQQKLTRIYNPATLPALDGQTPRATPPRVLVMGNIGHSQGLVEVVRAFEAHAALAALGAELVITGTGVAADEVRAAISTERVQMKGVVSERELQQELGGAAIGLVAQTPEIPEFNFPSKLMNYLAAGLPVVGFVGPGSEVAGVLAESAAGFHVDNRDPAALGRTLAELLGAPERLDAAAAAAERFAAEQLTPDSLAAAFERRLLEVTAR